MDLHGRITIVLKINIHNSYFATALEINATHTIPEIWQFMVKLVFKFIIY